MMLHTSACLTPCCLCILQVQLERLLAKQMEILHDAAAQDRLQALEWRVPPGPYKRTTDRQNSNGLSADKNTDQQGEFVHYKV